MNNDTRQSIFTSCGLISNACKKLQDVLRKKRKLSESEGYTEIAESFKEDECNIEFVVNVMNIVADNVQEDNVNTATKFLILHAIKHVTNDFKRIAEKDSYLPGIINDLKELHELIILVS